MREDEIELAKSLYSTMPLRAIAKQLGYHHKTISKYLKAAGIEVINKGNAGQSIKQHLIPDKKEVNKLYRSGLSIQSIADKLGSAEHIVSRLIEVPRTPGETMAAVLGHEERIKDLYQSGLSSYDIADILNISNPDNISRYLKRHNLLRTRDEMRKIVAFKLAKGKRFNSRPQKELSSILTREGIEFETEFPLDGWNFDFRIGKLLIELQSYWHKLPDRINRDKKKYKVATQAGYRVLYLWDFELRRQQFIIDQIRYHLGLINPIPFNLSDIVIRPDLVAARQLVETYHYLGKMGISGLNYVAFLGDIPIAACILSHITRNGIAIKQGIAPSEILELSRLVIHPEYQAKNLASWLIARCSKLAKRENSTLRRLVAFSDTTHNHYGVIYRASGWRLDGQTPSNYWYVTPNRTIKHKKAVWMASQNMGLTEGEYASKFKLIKVFGMPKNRYIKDL